MSKYLNESFQKLKPYTPGEQAATQDIIKLNTNENPYPPSKLASKLVLEQMDMLQLYSDHGCKELAENFAAYLNISPKNIMFGNGSDELLAFCFMAFCDKGAAFADITYGFYPVYCGLFGVEPTIIPLSEDFSISPNDYYGLNKTIVIANPNAPSGLALSLEQISMVVESNPENLVIIDEAYVDYGAESAVKLVDKYNNLLIIGTFSKSRQMAGGRLGYAIGNEDVIADLNRLRYSINPFNVNRLSAAAGIASIKDDEYFQECRDKILETRTKTLKSLRELGFYCTESLANFVFCTHNSIKAKVLYDELSKKGILTRWFNQPRIDNYLRITIGTDAQMEVLISRIAKLINKNI